MEKENKVKKFFKENREVITGVAIAAACTAIGAGAMYYAKKDAIELGNALDAFKSKNGKNDLMEHMTKYIGSSKDIIFNGGINNPYCTDCEQKLIEQGALTPERTVAGLYALIINKKTD